MKVGGVIRPDVESALAPLKPFQRRTVDHAFHRLFEAADSTGRFLVADEVGLGKTLVARGVVARTIDHLWDDVERIHVVYICSNGSIARSNLPKLQIHSAEKHSLSLATRLTMLATHLAPQEGRAGLSDNKLNFVSFTPSTSFDMGNALGNAPERVVLFRLFESLIPRRTALMNLLQGNVTQRERWRARLNYDEVPIDPSIQARLENRFLTQEVLRNELDSVLSEWCGRYRKYWPEEARQLRNRVVGGLRQLVAEVCIDALKPDLVIMDEFQRFKPLMEPRSEHRTAASELAQSLFNATTPEGNPVRTLLLSATPYKLYTADAEIEDEDHYEDFIATTSFLTRHDAARVGQLKRNIARFGNELKFAAEGRKGCVVAAKMAVQRDLQSIMARTERVDASEGQDAMLEDVGLSLSCLLYTSDAADELT